MDLSEEDLVELRGAKWTLEHPGLVAKLSSALGSPLEKGMKLLPARVQQTVHEATQAALLKALEVAVSSLGEKRASKHSDRLHQFAAAASGAAGGAFGIVAIGIELPVSTTVMLRSIADIAMAAGEDPRQVETKLACLTVFALGSTRDASDNAAESGYFAARSALATAVSEASRHIAQKGLQKGSAPALVRLIALIGSRFGIVVSEKAAAQMVPIIGAAGGALINTVFISHYQDMARGHFTVRKLERKYGPEAVRLAYEAAGVTGS
ncbi:MAG: EcsC family protein [Betaproteobacteria bacterium]